MIMQPAAGVLMLLFATVAPAHASASTEGPIPELRTRVDRAVQILADPATKGNIPERRLRLRKLADEIFDFTEMSKRALGPHWQQLQPGDRERFTRSFADLLDRAYFEKIDSYSGEKVQYLAPKMEGNQATVPTRVTTDKGTEIPVEYRMHKAEQGRWMVYDVSIEGVSMVSNYRSQFDRIIRTSSVNDLIKRMESQAAGQGGSAAPREPRGR